jgi:hypothetical protein
MTALAICKTLDAGYFVVVGKSCQKLLMQR